MKTSSPTVSPSVIEEIANIPVTWHGSGCLTPEVIRAIARHCGNPTASLETGSGKSTLLFSHLSSNHIVFAWDQGDGSIEKVKESPLFNPDNVEFVNGPTQQTLPAYQFNRKFQVALIDGPHGYPFPDLEYYYIYPLLEPQGILILDDIHIPNIYNIFQVLCKDEMFTLIEIVRSTAFFRRTSAPVFDPLGDGWWEQGYNLEIYEAIKQGKTVTVIYPYPNGFLGKFLMVKPFRVNKKFDWSRKIYRFKKWWKDRLPPQVQIGIRFMLRLFGKSSKA